VFLQYYMDQTKPPGSSIKGGAGRRYGPDFLRLIESPEFRSHFESEAWPVATKRFEPQGALSLKTAVEPRMDPDLKPMGAANVSL